MRLKCSSQTCSIRVYCYRRRRHACISGLQQNKLYHCMCIARVNTRSIGCQIFPRTQVELVYLTGSFYYNQRHSWIFTVDRSSAPDTPNETNLRKNCMCVDIIIGLDSFHQRPAANLLLYKLMEITGLSFTWKQNRVLKVAQQQLVCVQV